MLHLEYQVYIDGASDAPSAEIATARCRAALASITSYLSSRLDGCVWQREPFELWLSNEPTDAEPHLCGRMCCGDSVDDEWCAVGLLLQLTSQHPDATVVARDGDGELLLIEAAHAIPRWLTPETAENRVFLRGGELHIVPRPRTPAELALIPALQPLPLPPALSVLRAGLADTRCAAASEAIKSRVAPLLGGPPQHRARAVRRIVALELDDVAARDVAAARRRRCGALRGERVALVHEEAAARGLAGPADDARRSHG